MPSKGQRTTDESIHKQQIRLLFPPASQPLSLAASQPRELAASRPRPPSRTTRVGELKLPQPHFPILNFQLSAHSIVFSQIRLAKLHLSMQKTLDQTFAQKMLCVGIGNIRKSSFIQENGGQTEAQSLKAEISLVGS